ncbi:unnamed protein product [Camellia sinensis]
MVRELVMGTKMAAALVLRHRMRRSGRIISNADNNFPTGYTKQHHSCHLWSPPSAAGILGIIKKLGKDSVERQSEQLGEAEKFYGEHSQIVAGEASATIFIDHSNDGPGIGTALIAASHSQCRGCGILIKVKGRVFWLNELDILLLLLYIFFFLFIGTTCGNPTSRDGTSKSLIYTPAEQWSVGACSSEEPLNIGHQTIILIVQQPLTPGILEERRTSILASINFLS